MTDKNKAIIEYLLQCPQIQESPLYFNFINAKDSTKQIITQADDVTLNRVYVDGSVAKRFTFTIIDFRSISSQALVKIAGYDNENVEDLLDIQGIVDWISDQNDAKNYPNFGENCIIDEIRATTNTPALNGIDNTISPPLAKYGVTIVILYIDTSRKIWK